MIAYCIGLLGYKILRRQSYEELLYNTQLRSTNLGKETHGNSQWDSSSLPFTVEVKDQLQNEVKLKWIDTPQHIPQEELDGESALSAEFFFNRGMEQRDSGNNELAFTYFARSMSIIARYEPARDELKKMSAECLNSVRSNPSRQDLQRLLVRAVEMDPLNSNARTCLADALRDTSEPDLTKKCFIFYDGERASAIFGEAYKRALEFVTIGGVVGDVLEFGVLGGWSTRLFCESMRDIFNLSNIHLFDSFDGLPDYGSQVDVTSYEIGGRKIWTDKMRFPDSFLTQFGNAHEVHIRQKLGEIIRIERVFIHKGFYSETLQRPLNIKASIVHIDCDLYQSTCEVLWGLYRQKVLQDGCVLLFDDWNCNRANPNYGERRAFQEFLQGQKEFTASSWYSYGYNGMAFILHDTAI